MSRAGRIARRTFLVGSVAIAGGVAFGVWKARRPVANPLRPGEGEVTLNPYVLIDGSGVTVIAPRAEMGQGVQSTLAALVAEEMDLDWEAVRVLHGPPARAYFNGALLGPGIPVNADRGVLHDVHQAAADLVPRALGLQITAGSTSLIDAFDKMRHAGAAARATLLAVAARRTGQDPGRLRTEDGAVVTPEGLRLPYEELAEEAAGVEPPREPRLKSPAEWRLLGRALPRLDMVAKVTGTETYGADLRLPGMLHATVKMSPRLGAKMRSIDMAEALQVPGVEKIVEFDDGFGVIARDTWTAMRAADLVRAEWDRAPYPATTGDIFERIALAFDSRPNSRLRNDGDAPARLTSAAPGAVFEAEYRLPYLAHSTMEPMSATALLRDGHLEIWAGNQIPISFRDAVGRAVGLRGADVTLHTLPMGGGFGRRAEVDFGILAARLAAAVPGRPVSMTWTREEDMTHDFYRPGVMARARAVVGPDGPEAIVMRVAGPSVSRQGARRLTGFAPPGPDHMLVEGAHDQPYRIPDFLVTGHIADVAVPVGYWRSVGHSHNCFFHECLMDELAHQSGLDPLEMRLRLIDDPTARGVLEAVAEMSGWGGEKRPGTGLGLAFSRSFGAYMAQVVELSETGAGLRVTRGWAAVDVGLAIDPGTVEAQVVSGMIYGLSAAVMGEITFADGMVEQRNFPDYDALRMDNTPRIAVRILETAPHLGGIGEPGTPPSMPAVANALFDLTGERVRELPLNRRFTFA